MADTILLKETQAFADMQSKVADAQKFADMFSVPDMDGAIGVVSDVTASMRVQYNDGSSTRIHTSDGFAMFFSEFLKANAFEMVSRTMTKASEMLKAQQSKAAQEVEDQLNFSKYIPGTGDTPPTSPTDIPSITSPLLAVAYADEAFTYTITAESTSSDPITFSASGLPVGLMVNPTNGLITGSVSAPGIYTITLVAQNSAGQGQKVLQLAVAQKTTSTDTPVAPTIFGVMAASAQEGVAFNYTCNAANLPASGNAWSASGLPSGLTMDANTGVISGTPAAGSAGSYTVTLTVTASSGTDTETLNLTVTA